MSSVARQYDPSFAHLGHASLMHAEPRHRFDPIIVRLRVSWKNSPKFIGHACPELLLRQCSILTISNAPQPILRDSHRDEPVFGVYRPLKVRPAVFVEVVVDLYTFVISDTMTQATGYVEGAHVR